MDKPIKVTDSLLQKPGFLLLLHTTAILGAIASVFAFFGISKENTPLASLAPLGSFILVVTCGVQVLALYGLYRIYIENKAFRDSWGLVHDINHYLRDEVSSILTLEPERIESRLLREKIILNETCKLMSEVFWRTTGRKCHVCITLNFSDSEDDFCFLWARGDHATDRAIACSQKFRISKNTKFKNAIDSGKPSRFFSNDLHSEINYEDELSNWWDFYDSMLVVPIKRVNGDILGFIKVETKSTNRLNDTYHPQLLAAFADSIFTTVTLLRRASVVDTASANTNASRYSVLKLETANNVHNMLAYRLVSEGYGDEGDSDTAMEVTRMPNEAPLS